MLKRSLLLLQYYSAFFAAFLGAAFFAASFLGAAFADVFAAVFFFGRETPVEPIWILPRLVLLSPFPIINLVYACKSKKLSLPNKNYKALLYSFTGPAGHANITAIKNTFHKKERLCSKKQMEMLFGKGASGHAYPVKLINIDTDAALDTPAQAMFVAPKRSFKRAHDRNKLKRRMREAYRLHKAPLYELLNTGNRKTLLAFIYTGKKIENYKVIEAAIVKLLEKRFKR